MANKWYLTTKSVIGTHLRPPDGEQSSALPGAAGTNDRVAAAEGANGRAGELSLTTAPYGLVGTSATSSISTNHISSYMRRFTWDRPVKGGLYGTGNWSLAVQVTEDQTTMNAFLVSSLYFWDPMSRTVRGFIYDSTTQLGSEFASVFTGQIVTMAGANVRACDGDLLVLEHWFDYTPSMTTLSLAQTRYGGTIDVTVGYTGTDPAAYLQAPTGVDIPALAPPLGGQQTVILPTLPTVQPRSILPWGL